MLVAGRRHEGKAVDLIGPERPTFVAIVAAGGKAGAVGHALDGDGEAFGARRVDQRAAQIDGDGVAMPPGGGRRGIFRVGHLAPTLEIVTA